MRASSIREIITVECILYKNALMLKLVTFKLVIIFFIKNKTYQGHFRNAAKSQYLAKENYDT